MPEVAMIKTLDQLNAGINRKVSGLADETVDIVEQWDRLGAVGGQRDDHQAQLLMRLVPHLKSLASFATACVERIEQYHADPFGRKKTDG